METRKNFLDREMTDCAPTGNADCNTERRDFLAACTAALMVSASTPPSLHAAQTQPVKRYQTSILADQQGLAVRTTSINPLTNYLFHYPYVATPCLLIDMGRDVGGVGRKRSIVAFSAICSHKLAYPAREVSFIRFQSKASTHSEAERIHCCADHSVYDPGANGSVVAGPAPAALAVVALEYDSVGDTLKATGVSGVEQFDAFFAKYDFKLTMEFAGRARSAVSSTTHLQELTKFCRNVAQC